MCESINGDYRNPGKTILHLLARYMQDKQETCKIHARSVRSCKNTVLQDLDTNILVRKYKVSCCFLVR